MAKREVELVLRGRDQASEVFARVERSADGFSRQMRSLKATLAGAFAGFGLAGVMRESIGEITKQMDAEAKLGAVLRSTGHAIGFNAKQLKDYSDELMKATTFADDEILNAEAVLATFTKVQGETFKAAVKSALDLSAVMGQDLQSSVTQLGKALNDPIKGITALSRVGVSFSDQQKELIKSLVGSNDLMGAQKVILAELQREFGGAAEAMAGTMAGRLKQAANAWGEIKEQIGAAIAPAVVGASQAFTHWGNTIADTARQLDYFRGTTEDFGESIRVMIVHPLLSARMAALDLHKTLVKYKIVGGGPWGSKPELKRIDKEREEVALQLFPPKTVAPRPLPPRVSMPGLELLNGAAMRALSGVSGTGRGGRSPGGLFSGILQDFTDQRRKAAASGLSAAWGGLGADMRAFAQQTLFPVFNVFRAAMPSRNGGAAGQLIQGADPTFMRRMEGETVDIAGVKQEQTTQAVKSATEKEQALLAENNRLLDGILKTLNAVMPQARTIGG